VPAASNSPAPSGASSDCIVLETLSTPAKAKAPDVIVLNPAIANPAHVESKKGNVINLTCTFKILGLRNALR
jgi:hypothetical protein